MGYNKDIEWTDKKWSGFVDIGTNIDSDNLPYAKELFVLMVVSLMGKWKIPVGYFF